MFYIYENWRADNKTVIHQGTCGNCNDGRGCQDNPLGNKNGKWHGPFESLEEAEEAAMKIDRPNKKKHRCIQKQLSINASIHMCTGD